MPGTEGAYPVGVELSILDHYVEKGLEAIAAKLFRARVFHRLLKQEPFLLILDDLFENQIIDELSLPRLNVRESYSTDSLHNG